MNKKKLSIVGMALIALLLFISGCSSNNASSELEEISTAQGESLSSSGTIILKINPEIAVEYDEAGLVTRIVGKNDDGQEIVDTYHDFIGKDSGLVLEELIALIDEAGYFVEEVEGEARRIVLELESGSVLPEDNFLEILTINIQNAVSNLNTEADVVQEEASDKDKDLEVEEVKTEKSEDKAKTQKENYIGMDKAKNIAMNHAGVQASQVRWDDAEFDIDDGVPHYELEFDVGENEYEYDVHAVTGNIIKYEQDIQRKQVSEKPKAQAPVSQPAPQKPKAPAPAPAPAPKPAPEPAPKPAPAKKQPAVAKELSRDEAINIALNHAGLTRSQVVFDDVELDYDDGRKKWEIEFDHGNWEYEYDIDAANGSILDFEKEYDD